MTDRNTDRNTIEGFARRWSRRKLAVQGDGAAGGAEDLSRPGETTPEVGPGGSATDRTRDFTNFDFDALDFSSDYTRFMQTDVPADVRNRALKALWSSSDVIGQPDELDDYLEDFTEEAKSIPAELARSAYQVGRGFATAEEHPEAPSDGSADAAAPSDRRTEASETSSQEQTAETPGDAGGSAQAGGDADAPDTEAGPASLQST